MATEGIAPPAYNLGDEAPVMIPESVDADPDSMKPTTPEPEPESLSPPEPEFESSSITEIIASPAHSQGDDAPVMIPDSVDDVPDSIEPTLPEPKPDSPSPEKLPMVSSQALDDAPRPLRTIQAIQDSVDSDDDEDFEDETLVERLIGLTEMFPPSFREKSYSFFTSVLTSSSGVYSFARQASFVVATSAVLCFFPLFIELERVQTEEQEAVHQRTMMLGPRAAGVSSGSNLAGFSAALPQLTPVEPG